MGVKLSDLAVNFFLSAELNAGLLVIGVAISCLLERLEVVDLTGVELNLEIPTAFKNSNEETGCFFFLIDGKAS